MIEPPPTHDEPSRLASLWSLGVLDTAAEERFDRITRIASRVAGVPIAVVSLVDTNRQWFKSCIGLDAPETPRSVSFCGHAIQSDRPLVVPDALLDERFADNPLVTGPPHIRFYAGFPLADHAGHVLGTLCVIGDRPGELDETARAVLTDLAEVARRELLGPDQQRRAVEELLEAHIRAAARSAADADADTDTGDDVHAGARADVALVRVLGQLAPVGVFQTDVDGVIELVDPGWVDITGVAAADAIGTNWRTYLPRRLAGTVDRALEAAGSDVAAFELVLVPAGGGRRHCVFRVLSLRDAAGAPRGHLATVEDITERRADAEALRSSELVHRSVLGAMNDGVVIVSARGDVVAANAAAERMFGTTTQELAGRPLPARSDRAVDGEGDTGGDLDRLDRVVLRTASPATGDLVLCRADRSVLDVTARAVPLVSAGGALREVVLTMTEADDRRRVDDLQRQFVSTVSHELRTPLASIRGAIGLLAGGAVIPPDKHARLLTIADANAGRLSRLIDDLLDLERLDAGVYELLIRPTSIRQVVADTADMLSPLAADAGVDLVHRAADATVLADAERVSQTLVNLVSNALKFSPSGSTVTIDATASEAEVEVHVRDEGRGIPVDRLESIFERFSQVEAGDSRSKGGAGLGLAICRAVVEQHGGRIWAESVPGRGSTFTFTLPRDGAADGARGVGACG